MKLSDLKKGTVYVNPQGFDEMVVLDTERTYDDRANRIGNSMFVDPGRHVAVLMRADSTVDLAEAAGRTRFVGGQTGATFVHPGGGAFIRFVAPHEIAGEPEAVRANLEAQRTIRQDSEDRLYELTEKFPSLIPDLDTIKESPNKYVLINIEVLERLVALAQKGKEA